jgi:hypothetical protein
MTFAKLFRSLRDQFGPASFSSARRSVIFGGAVAAGVIAAHPVRALPTVYRLKRRGRSPIPRFRPSAQWGVSGVAGSGFNGGNPAPPVDPTRTGPKVRARLLTVPYQTVIGGLLIAIAASAKGGIGAVNMWAEGTVSGTNTKVTVPYLDSNAVKKLRRGCYAFMFDYAATMALNVTGSVQFYVEVIPKDPTILKRVLGPYLVHARAPGVGAGLQYDTSLTLTPSQPQTGTNYQTLQAAALFCKNNGKIRPLITVTENCNLDFTTPLSSAFTSVGTWATLTHAPGVVANIVTTGFTTARLKYGGMRYSGAGIIFKPDQFTQLYAEDNDNVWLDGCQFVGVGPYAMFGNTRTVPQVSLLRNATVNAPTWWCTDVNLSDYYNGFSGCELVLNCTLSRMAGDALQNSRCIHGCTVDSMTTGPLRDPAANPSLQITNGTGVAVTIAATNAANSSTRVITVTVGGTPNTFNVDQSTGGANWRFQNFADFLTGLGVGLVPVVLSDAMRLVYMQMAGTASAPTAAFNGGSLPNGTPVNIPIGGTITIGACYDDHADVQQNFSSGLITSNVMVLYNTFTNIGTDIQEIFLDHTASNFQDCDWSYNIGVNGLRSFVDSPNSHVGFTRNTFAGAAFNWVASNAAMTSTTATISGNVLTIPGTTLSYKYLAVGMTVTGAGITAGTVVAGITHQFDGTNTVATLNNGGMTVGPGVTITIQPSGENYAPDAYCEHTHNAYDTAAWTLAAGGAAVAAGIDQNWVRSGAAPTLSTNTTLAGGAAWSTFVVDAANNNYAPLPGQLLAPDGLQAGALLPNQQYNDAA